MVYEERSPDPWDSFEGGSIPQSRGGVDGEKRGGRGCMFETAVGVDVGDETGGG